VKDLYINHLVITRIKNNMKLRNDLYSELCKGGFGDMGTMYGREIFNEMRTYHNNLCKHSINVSNLSMEIADLFGLNTRVAGFAGFLHDVGKLLLFYDEVIKKRGREFGSDDYEKIKDHTVGGYIELKRRGFSLASEVARDHHKLQGSSSYPDMIEGEEISSYCKIVALADCYEAKKFRHDREVINLKKSNRQILEEERPGMEREIERIYNKGIFIH
jgi:putative nucleotidyltransferase with HDIG domain